MAPNAVDRFNELEGCKPFLLTVTNHNDADIMQELKYWKSKLPITITARWVRSHHNKCNTREARLNRIVDHLAGTQHNKKGYWESKNATKMLLQMNAQLIVRG